MTAMRTSRVGSDAIRCGPRADTLITSTQLRRDQARLHERITFESINSAYLQARLRFASVPAPLLIRRTLS